LALGLSKLLTLCSLNSSGCMGSFVICTGYSEQNRLELFRDSPRLRETAFYSS
jgi:hypothetical protein